MNFFKTIISSFLFVFCLIINQVNAEELRIGTASQGGAFYPVGQAISTLVNKHAKGLEMVPVVTGGSVQNPKLVNKKEVDIAITNNNLAVLANKGAAMYKKSGKMSLRAIGALHFSVLHMMTLNDSSIDTINDLKGKRILKEKTKRINLAGYPSGMYNMIIIYDKMRWNKRVIKQ